MALDFAFRNKHVLELQAICCKDLQPLTNPVGYNPILVNYCVPRQVPVFFAYYNENFEIFKFWTDLLKRKENLFKYFKCRGLNIDDEVGLMLGVVEFSIS